MIKEYFPFIISGCVTLLAVYLNDRSRKKYYLKSKSEFETTTHQPAESIKTHKPTEEYIKFLEKPSKKKAIKKFSIARPSPSAFKPFLFGLLVFLLDNILIVIFMITAETYRIWEPGSIVFGFYLLFYGAVLTYAVYLVGYSVILGIKNAFQHEKR